MGFVNASLIRLYEAAPNRNTQPSRAAETAPPERNRPPAPERLTTHNRVALASKPHITFGFKAGVATSVILPLQSKGDLFMIKRTPLIGISAGASVNIPLKSVQLEIGANFVQRGTNASVESLVSFDSELLVQTIVAHGTVLLPIGKKTHFGLGIYQGFILGGYLELKSEENLFETTREPIDLDNFKNDAGGIVQVYFSLSKKIKFELQYLHGFKGFTGDKFNSGTPITLQSMLVYRL